MSQIPQPSQPSQQENTSNKSGDPNSSKPPQTQIKYHLNRNINCAYSHSTKLRKERVQHICKEPGCFQHILMCAACQSDPTCPPYEHAKHSRWCFNEFLELIAQSAMPSNPKNYSSVYTQDKLPEFMQSEALKTKHKDATALTKFKCLFEILDTGATYASIEKSAEALKRILAEDDQFKQLSDKKDIRNTTQESSTKPSPSQSLTISSLIDPSRFDPTTGSTQRQTGPNWTSFTLPDNKGNYPPSMQQNLVPMSDMGANPSPNMFERGAPNTILFVSQSNLASNKGVPTQAERISLILPENPKASYNIGGTEIHIEVDSEAKQEYQDAYQYESPRKILKKSGNAELQSNNRAALIKSHSTRMEMKKLGETNLSLDYTHQSICTFQVNRKLYVLDIFDTNLNVYTYNSSMERLNYKKNCLPHSIELIFKFVTSFSRRISEPTLNFPDEANVLTIHNNGGLILWSLESQNLENAAVLDLCALEKETEIEAYEIMYDRFLLVGDQTGKIAIFDLINLELKRIDFDGIVWAADAKPIKSIHAFRPDLQKNSNKVRVITLDSDGACSLFQIDFTQGKDGIREFANFEKLSGPTKTGLRNVTSSVNYPGSLFYTEGHQIYKADLHTLKIMDCYPKDGEHSDKVIEELMVVDSDKSCYFLGFRSNSNDVVVVMYDGKTYQEGVVPNVSIAWNLPGFKTQFVSGKDGLLLYCLTKSNGDDDGSVIRRIAINC